MVGAQDRTILTICCVFASILISQTCLAADFWENQAENIEVYLSNRDCEVQDSWTEWVGYGPDKIPIQKHKILHLPSQTGRTISSDQSGYTLSDADIDTTRRNAYRGKIHPLLQQQFAENPGARLPVTVWLAHEGADFNQAWAGANEPESGEEGPPPRRQSHAEMLHAVRAAEGAATSRRKAVAAVFFSIGDSFAAEAKSDGIEHLYTYTRAPAVVLSMTLEECRSLEARDDVNFMFAQEEYVDELDVISREGRATAAWANNYIGSGVTIAHIESGPVCNTNNPYLTLRAYRRDTPFDAHSTACSGIIKSTHATRRGIAHGCTMYVLNPSSTSPSNLLETAINWGLDRGVTILNQSQGLKATSDGEFHWSDIFYDFLVFHSRVLFTKSAGNFGSGNNFVVTSPCRGYNSLAVGNVNGNRTVDWSDDTMSSSSCYTNPVSGTEKPEVAFYGSSVYTTSEDPSVWVTNMGGGTSYAAPGVAGIAGLCVDRWPSLADEPQGLKALIMCSARGHNIEGDVRLSSKDGAGCALANAVNCGWAVRTITTNSFTNGYYEVTDAVSLTAGVGKRVVLVYSHLPDGKWATPDPASYVKADLDLYLYLGTNDSSVGGSNYGTRNPFEIIDYTPGVTTNGTVRILNWSWPAGIANLRVGVAWASTTSLGSGPSGAVSGDDNYEPNENLGTAYDLSNYSGDWLATVAGPGRQNDNDFYRVDISTNIDQLVVTCKFADADGDIDFNLLNAWSNLLFSGRSTSDNEGTVYTVPPGNTTYYFRIYYDNEGNGYDLKWTGIDLAPDAPLNVTAGGFGCESVQIDWSHSANADGYRIYYDEDTSNPPYQPINNGLPTSGSAVGYVNSVSITGLTAGATYYFSVIATNEDGWSDYSAEDSAVIGSACNPDAPTNVDARDGIGCGDISVSWHAVSGANGYRIFYEEGSGGPPYTPNDNGIPASGSTVGNVTNIMITDLDPGITYYVSVVATNIYGWSSYASPDPATVGNDCDDAYENNDTTGTASNLNEQTWLSSLNGKGVQSDSDFFRINVDPSTYRRVVATCDFVHAQGDINMALLNSTGGVETFVYSVTDDEVIDYVVPNSGTYYLHVYGENAGNTYDLWWDDLRSPPFKAVNPVPTNNAVGLLVDANVFWNNGGDADGYLVYFGTDSTPDVGEYKGEQSATTFEPGPLNYDTEYYWRIDSTNEYGITTGDVWQFHTEILLEDNYEENDASGTASNINEHTWLSSMDGVGYQRDDDWYRINVDPITYRRVVVTCQFSHAMGNIDMALINSTGGVETYVYTSTDNEIIEYIVPTSGWYYIRVYGVNAGTSYDLWWDDLPSPPFKAHTPSPVHSSMDQSLNVDGGDADTFDVFFGTDATPDSGEFKGNWAGVTFEPGALVHSNRYYWRINPRNAYGVTTGDVWYFETMAPVTLNEALRHVSGGILIKWNSVTGAVYTVSCSTNLPQGFASIATNLAAAPPQNTYTGSTVDSGVRAYRIELEE